MIENIVEFFKNLPIKLCKSCGNEMEEQFDCYTHTCDDCHKL